MVFLLKIELKICIIRLRLHGISLEYILRIFVYFLRLSVLHYFFVPCFGSEVFVSLFFAPFFDFPLVDVDFTLAGSTGSKVNI